MYNVLKPNYTRAGFTREGEPMYYVSWTVLGQAKSMKEAKKFHPTPVLEPHRGRR